ncbi:hypothetical protein PLESTB_001466600 [Pleodorina starrii]|uniref:Uncharacterized protein n=1 Tax=Pleodorina starrii TaxID=330485 RepID=A0A9W6F863_9CHLO|nr:hypothetical protein PLESTB_001466600 [Pleodorina starrii]GLC74816.1 hypothetical protein PLESTF_001559200 [Pleodorina starrii]
MARLKPGKHQLPTLDTGPVPLVYIREQARKQLLEVVDLRRGKKALVLDPAISGPLGLLDTSLTDLLTEHGVVKLLYLEPGKRLDDPSYNATEPRLSDVRSVLYLVRPTVANAQAVAAQIKSRNKFELHDFSVCFIPRRTIACERILEEEGVLGDVVIGASVGRSVGRWVRQRMDFETCRTTCEEVCPHTTCDTQESLIAEGRGRGGLSPAQPPGEGSGQEMGLGGRVPCRVRTVWAHLHWLSFAKVRVVIKKMSQRTQTDSSSRLPLGAPLPPAPPPTPVALPAGEYCLDMVPYDDDVISLELDTAFYDCVCDGDSTPLYYTAAAITRLQALFGIIPRVQGKGPAAAAVRDMCFRMRRESSGLLAAPPLGGGSNGAGAGGSGFGIGSGRIDRLILLDREVDLITPMMTQITFEGLIDEITGIRHGSVPWQSKDKRAGEAGDSHGPGGSRAPVSRLPLNSTDIFFREFRDLPFHIAIMRLQQYALEARREFGDMKNKNFTELKNYVKDVPKVYMLDRLSDIAVPPAEQVKQQAFHDRLNKEQAIVEGYEPEANVAFIEELMYKGADLMEVLRLLVLLSTVGGGLPRRQLDSLRSEVLHTYGHQHLLTLNALEKSGLLKAAPGTRSPFHSVRKALQLIVPEQEGPAGGGAGAGSAAMDTPSDVSHLWKGYAPLSIRLVETALRSGWGPQLEVLAHLPGSQFDVLQTVDSNGMPVEKPYKATAGASASGGLGTTSSISGTSGGGGVGSSGSLQGTGSLGAGSSAAAAASSSSGGQQQQAETVLVAFIGGVTFAEISALRFLSSRPEWPYRFLVLTTKIVNGRTLLQTFVDPLANEFSASG